MHAGDRKYKDVIRVACRDARRIAVLRVRAVDVFGDLDNVLTSILRVVEDRIGEE